MAQSKFVRRLDDEHQKAFAKIFDGICERHGRWKVFEDFVILSAIAFSNRVDASNAEEREARYMRKTEEYAKEELKGFAHMLAELTMSLDKNPEQDFMGKLFMNLELGNDAKGQFFTPYDVSRCMAGITLEAEDIRAKADSQGWVSVSDPACGAGGMLIAAFNAIRDAGRNPQTQALFVAQDVDETAGLMCYLQMSLLGMAGYVVIDNTLTKPALSLDRRYLIPKPGSNVWYTPMYFTEVWHMRRQLAKLDALFQRTCP